MTNRRTDDQRRQHASNMFAWEDQVAKDSWLGQHCPHAGLIVMLLRKKMNHEGETGPIDHRWISQQVGCSVRTVQRCLNALVDRDHIEIISGKSTGIGNKYRAKVKQKSNIQPVGSDTRVRPGTTPESDQYTSSFIFTFRAPCNQCHGGSQPNRRELSREAGDMAETNNRRCCGGTEREPAIRPPRRRNPRGASGNRSRLPSLREADRHGAGWRRGAPPSRTGSAALFAKYRQSARRSGRIVRQYGKPSQ